MRALAMTITICHCVHAPKIAGIFMEETSDADFYAETLHQQHCRNLKTWKSTAKAFMAR
jgi:hypothetical protein